MATARWLVRSDRAESFWRVLLPNGVRGRIKRELAKRFFPRVTIVRERVNANLPDFDYFYLGVDDGKRTYVMLRIEGECLRIRKYPASTASKRYLRNEQRVLETLVGIEPEVFPQLIATSDDYVELLGKLPYIGFDARSIEHRTLLTAALAKFYSRFELTLDEYGAVTCMCHGDLNRWNIFLGASNTPHIFDFETARPDYLGSDLVTAFSGALHGEELESALHDGLVSLAELLRLKHVNLPSQMLKARAHASC